MARHSKMAVAFVGAGFVVLAGNAFVNPTPPSTLPGNVQYSSYAGSRAGAADGEAPAFEEQTSSLAGLFAGVVLGLAVGLTGGMSGASAAVESPTTGLVKQVLKESYAPDGHGSWDATPQDFDKNVSSLLTKKLEYLDVEKNFNPEGIGNRFPVDKSQIPEVVYPKLQNVKNSPDARINGDGDAPVAVQTKQPEVKQVVTQEVKQEEVKQEVKKAEEAPAKKGGFSFFKKRL